MKCAICGKDNQAGTRFCVHCGAALAAPPAGAVLTTGISSVARPVAPPPVPPPRPAPPPPPPPLDVATGPRPVAPAPSVPAYDVAPKKASVVFLLLGLVALVAVGGYVGYKVFGVSTEVRDTLSRSEALPTPSPPVPTTAPPPIAPPNVPSEPAKPAEEKATEPPVAAAQPTGDAVEPGKSPSSIAPRSDAKAAPPRPAPVPKDARSSAIIPTTPPPPAAPAPVPRSAAAGSGTPEVTPPVQDRWVQMGDELRRCQREAFLSRVVCDQRVRLRFCDGYWGKVTQCPGGVANPDRGQ